jgi:hypothetical protein
MVIEGSAELHDAVASGGAVPEEHTLAFLPWLALSDAVTIQGVRFVPFFPAASDAATPELAGAAPFLRRILAGYVDVQGRPIDRCTVLCLPDATPAWHIPEGGTDAVSKAVTLLAFVGLAGNRYFSGGDAYTNTAAFAVYFQRLSPGATTIAVETRQRDGWLLSGGYAHGDWKFSVPVQCASMRPPAIDPVLIAALDRAAMSGSVVLRRLHSALAFVLLASTDDSTILTSAEIILMASAFEQLLGSRDRRTLGQAIEPLLSRYGAVTAGGARTTRTKLTFDPKYRTDQERWFVHRKWIEDLYDLRSDYVHGNALDSRKWAWSPFEHLVMAAYAFPILVKVLLAAEGHYRLTALDHDRCHALDRLLAATMWGSTATRSGVPVWQDIVVSVTRDRERAEAGEGLEARLTALVDEG